MLSLNENQKQAVSYFDGHLLIIAGPGTGKTHTLTKKIGYLIKEKNIDTEKIAAITFTNKAAKEMKKRLENVLDAKPKSFIGTFHSFCLQILRKEISELGYEKNFLILQEKEQLQIIKNIFVSVRKIRSFSSQKIANKKFKKLQSIISLVKNQNSGIFALKDFSDRLSSIDVSEKLFIPIFHKYEEELKDANKLDFDDLILKTLELFEKKPNIQKKYQDAIHYLFIDEYQDINESQYNLIRALVSNHTKICAIGDPDQAIYAFRGSNVEHFLKFTQNFPGTKTINLEENYRSTQNILKAANNLIQNNKNRLEKKVTTQNEQGALITVFETSNPWQEAASITKEIETLMGGINMLQSDAAYLSSTCEKSFNFSDFAVLYRTKGQGRFIEECFKRTGIPYQHVSGTPWYQKKEILLILSYIQVLMNTDDDTHLENIINTPARGIGEGTIQSIKHHARKKGWSVFSVLMKIDSITEVSNTQKENISGFLGKILSLSEKVENTKPVSLVKEIIKIFDIENFFKDGSYQGEKKYQNILLFLSNVSQFDEHTGKKGLMKLIEYFSLLKESDSYDKNLEAVTLMTLHASKGLEFPVVFISGCEDGLIPYKKEGEENDIEEERRLFYVGITRAKQKLIMSRARTREENERNISPFIQEIPKNLLTRREVGLGKKKKEKKQMALF